MRALLGLAGIALAAASLGAGAATFQADKVVRLIVPFAPGGTSDVVARTLAPKLSEGLGRTVIVENLPGGGTIIGTQTLVRSPADGYAIMLATPDLTINPSLQPNLPYDARKDVVPVALVGTYPMVLVANASQKLSSVADVLAHERAKPGDIYYASAGNGSMPHLCAELFNYLAKTHLTHVPYKGNGPAITDLLAGRVSLLFTGAPPVVGYLQAGTLRALAVTSPARNPALPDVPTLQESGVPGYDVSAWFGFIAPAGTPAEVVSRLNGEINRALKDPDVRKRLAGLGADVTITTPEAFGALLKSETDKWARVVGAARIRLD
ncbi:MAG TPA: tripartite tricarboxylate transporter substrate binding protein [Usitatibacter sp.]|jgi:tripartite-type tricarboxylate transporter receptor subunit TctC|nr:tripartite tricarboxylate transporter substrate binding protein [Usitatibacter sp.]